MQGKAISILEGHNVMTIATLRPDGWPQATTVGYVNNQLMLYFLIARTSQKFSNITADDRVSITISSDPASEAAIEGVSMAARVSELRDEPYRSAMLAKLSARHPGYFDPKTLDMGASALMRASPEVISVIDYSKGLGHAELITVGAAQMVELMPGRANSWGPNPAH